MTAEIITPGPPHFEATCARCGTAFRYQLADVSETSWAMGATVACPSCAHRHDHPDQRHRSVRL